MLKLNVVANLSKYVLVLAAKGVRAFLFLIATLLPLVLTAQTKTNGSQSDAELVEAGECVILLHGLARSAASMNKMEAALIHAGFSVANIDYPSRTESIQQLADPTLERGLSKCKEKGAAKNHIVTHSMGGILYRQYVSENDANVFQRVVMLAPPNRGSEAVDGLKKMPGFAWLNGPAGSQLGTGENSVPLTLGPARNEIAVVAGTFSINLILSSYLPNPDDGKVSVESTKMEGMCAHLQVNVSHPFIMKDKAVIKEVIAYLKSGKFNHANAHYPECTFRVPH